MVNPPGHGKGGDRDDPSGERKRRSAKFLRAMLRHRVFTLGADRLTGGRLSRNHAKQQTVVRRFEVSMPTWPRAWDGLRIGHFSDMHYGDLMSVERGVRVIELLGAEQPDLVAFTGDMVDLECDGAEPLFEAMVAIDAPLGAYMVVGNHDLLDDAPQVRTMATEAGVRVLDDEVVGIDRHGREVGHVGAWAHGLAGEHPLVVAGVEWDKSVKGLATRVETIAAENPMVLLAHNPKAFLPAARAGIPLVLSGHTHGGQMASKKRPGVNLAVAHRHSAGFYHRDVSTLFVTVGTGSWFPLRVQCPAEVAIITCRAAEMGVREI